MPKLENLQKQRSGMMIHAGRTFQEWAQMTSWQREDFLYQFNEHQKKLEEQHKQMMEEMEAKMATLRTH